MKKTMTRIAIALLAFASLAAFAQDKSIHIDFESTEEGGTTFAMSLPVTVIKSFRPQIEQFLSSTEFQEADIDFAELWAAARESGPTEFLEVNNAEVNVKVQTTDTHLLINGESVEEGIKFDVKLPLALGDMFFSDLQDIDYDGIIATLNDLDGVELVRVEGDTINGRIWIE